MTADRARTDPRSSSRKLGDGDRKRPKPASVRLKSHDFGASCRRLRIKPQTLRRRRVGHCHHRPGPVGTAVSNRALDDWPQWRGVEPRRAFRRARACSRAWPAGGPPLAWKAAGAGEGYSSFAAADGSLFTLGARGDREYVIAFDAAPGKEVWATPHGRRFGNDRGDGPRGTPTVEGRPCLRVRRQRRPERARGGERQGDLDGQRAAEVRRLEHHLGAERVAAGLGRSHPRQCRRTGASIVALQEEGRLGAVAKPGATSAGYSSAVRPRGRRRAAGDLLHRPARARRGQSPTDGCCGATAGGERHREHRDADRPRQSRVPVVGLRHRCGAARADAVGQRHAARKRCISPKRCATTTRARSSSATTSTGSRARS